MPFNPVEFIDRHQWTFAKSMPENPHEYVVRKNVADDEAFDGMVLHIRKQGRPRLFYGLLYLHWEHDGHTYWTMGWPVEKTIIINRARVEDSDAIHVSDGLADSGAYRWSSHDGLRPML